MKHEERYIINSAIRQMCVFSSAALLIAAAAAAAYLKEPFGQVLQEWYVILTSPSPLVTDYFRLGSLPAALLNAGFCGACCAAMVLRMGVEHRHTVWAGYFLVIAHCFYGLNLVNMWPPLLGFLVCCKIRRLRFRDNLDIAMFVTSFAPFFSEILFRYPMAGKTVWNIFGTAIYPQALLLTVLMAVFVGLALPAMLPGAAKLHRGYNLYNGGLATGLLGLLMYAFLFKTFGRSPEGPLAVSNPVYEAAGESYMLFGNVFFISISLLSILFGWIRNGRSFRGYGALLADSGYKVNFLKHYGVGPVWINFGLYCLMMLVYFDAVILLTEGAGFTGATFGIILAAMTFSAGGQHPRNVWPILLGYGLLSLLVHLCCWISGTPVPWTLSTQGYMNGLAFATGLCPFSGKFGWKVGAAAGFLSAVMCTTTSAMHGGFVLYNGGLTAGIAALILLPMLDTYVTRTEDWGRDDRALFRKKK